MSRYVDLDEVVEAMYYDEEHEEWRLKKETIESALGHVDNYTVHGWIPCSEGLPEMYERVLISVKEDGHNERIELAFLAMPAPRKIRFRAIPHWYEIDDVLAWQKLPEPYEVKEE